MMHQPNNGEAPLADWMSALDDGLPLHTLAMPGSHDACAYTVDDALVRTQCVSLDMQLAHGVRMLDIRCRHERDVFQIHHGGIALNMTFDDVLAACERFLATHPHECIVMSVKEEWPARDARRPFDETFDAYVAGHSRLRWHLGSVSPTLGEARGAIVLLRRFESVRPLGIDMSPWLDNQTFTIDRPGASFVVQDEYRVPVAASIDYKWRAIDALLTRMQGDDDRWAINFCSGTGMGANPSVVARGNACVEGIHARLARRLRTHRMPCGIVLLDFCDDGDWGLVRALVECNRWRHEASVGGR